MRLSDGLSKLAAPIASIDHQGTDYYLSNASNVYDGNRDYNEQAAQRLANYKAQLGSKMEGSNFERDYGIVMSNPNVSQRHKDAWQQAYQAYQNRIANRRLTRQQSGMGVDQDMEDGVRRSQQIAQQYAAQNRQGAATQQQQRQVQQPAQQSTPQQSGQRQQYNLPQGSRMGTPYQAPTNIKYIKAHAKSEAQGADRKQRWIQQQNLAAGVDGGALYDEYINTMGMTGSPQDEKDISAVMQKNPNMNRQQAVAAVMDNRQKAFNEHLKASQAPKQTQQQQTQANAQQQNSGLPYTAKPGEAIQPVNKQYTPTETTAEPSYVAEPGKAIYKPTAGQASNNQSGVAVNGDNVTITGDPMKKTSASVKYASMAKANMHGILEAVRNQNKKKPTNPLLKPKNPGFDNAATKKLIEKQQQQKQEATGNKEMPTKMAGLRARAYGIVR